MSPLMLRCTSTEKGKIKFGYLCKGIFYYYWIKTGIISGERYCKCSLQQLALGVTELHIRAYRCKGMSEYSNENVQYLKKIKKSKINVSFRLNN